MLIKKFVLAVIIMILLSGSALAADEPQLSAKSAALMVADSGELLYGKEETKRLSMASTTKIMTSLIALEQKDPKRMIKVSDSMLKVEGTSMGLLGGDTVTLETLVYGMLLKSGNDAANVAAISIAGSLDNFAVIMNDRAKQIGMHGTHFVTPSGLDNDEHYSTAYDMALLGCEAIKNPEFRFICALSSAKVSYGNPPYTRTLTNHNRLLKSYDGAFGIKTGFTKKSGRCLVSAVERDGITLVAVTLNASNDWNDHKLMLDYGFETVKSRMLELGDIKLNVVGGNKTQIPVACHEKPTAAALEVGKVEQLITLKKFVYAPVEPGEIVGTVKFVSDGKVICERALLADEKVDAVIVPREEEKTSFFERLFNKE